MEKTVSKPLETDHPKESELESRIKERLKLVVDPETGLDVVRMGLVKDICIRNGDKGRSVALTFKPTSPVCPLAFKLAWDMKQAVETLNDIETVEVKAEGYHRAAELEAVLKGEGNGG